MADGDYDIAVSGTGLTPYTIPDVSIAESNQGGFILDNDHINVLLANATYNRATTQWNRIATARPAWRVEADSIGADDYLRVFHAVAAANPITWSERLRITASGHLLYGDAWTVDVRAKGALGDGSDDTVPIQNAINDARSITQGPAYSTLSRAAIVLFPYGGYSVSNLDCTNCAGLHLIGKASWGVALYGDRQVTSSKPILDFTGSSSCSIQGITLHGQTPGGADPSIIPSCGLLFAQTTAGANSNKNHVQDVGTLGKFTNAAVYIYASTDHYFQACAFQQAQNGQPCMFIGNTNNYSQTSPYRTIATGTQTTGEMTFVSVELHDLATGSGASTVKTLQMQGVYSIRFFGGNNSCSGPAHVELLGTCRNLLFSGVQFYSDNGTTATHVIGSNGTNVYGLTLEVCDYQNGITAILGATTTASTYRGVQLKGYPAANGFSGSIAALTGASALVDCELVCDGLAVNAGASGTITRGRLINPGTITATTNTAEIITSGGGLRVLGGSRVGTQITLTYSATIATDAALGNVFRITATNGTAFTISNPTNLTLGQRVVYDILNSSGGALGAITWGANFLLAGAFTNPANTKRRLIEFYYDGTNAVEVSRAAADI